METNERRLRETGAEGPYKERRRSEKRRFPNFKCRVRQVVRLQLVVRCFVLRSSVCDESRSCRGIWLQRKCGESDGNGATGARGSDRLRRVRPKPFCKILLALLALHYEYSMLLVGISIQVFAVPLCPSLVDGTADQSCFFNRPDRRGYLLDYRSVGYCTSTWKRFIDSSSTRFHRQGLSFPFYGYLNL
jgi:hypothetical protein